MPAGRKPLSIADQVDRLAGSPVAKARLRVILANLAGEINIADACADLGIEESWFFDLKHESLEALGENPGTGITWPASLGGENARATTDRESGTKS